MSAYVAHLLQVGNEDGSPMMEHLYSRIVEKTVASFDQFKADLCVLATVEG
jgi:hypothetical protein